eukprot:5022328-Amphidinium_carterae.2
MSLWGSFRLTRQSALILFLMLCFFAWLTGWAYPVRCVCVPCEAFVVHHKRILALRKWVGPEIQPVRGLPQGDSLSVLFAVIWSIALHGVIRSVLPQKELTLAMYLDDVTFLSADPSLLLKALFVSESFMSSWHIQLNVSKTTLVLSQAAREQWPKEFCNVPHLASVRLLGVEMGPSPTGFLMQTRIDTALSRLTRIRMLPLPLVLVRRLVTSFVSPVLHFCVSGPSWSFFFCGPARTLASIV